MEPHFGQLFGEYICDTKVTRKRVLEILVWQLR